ncbi:ATP-binding protein [Oceanibacterium hippocampi]|uniref:histidine kinase n=1 Tax=Oceanibacterium hippocampi TaxID=745714 RepID=A0A1Y5T3Z7_9PROT|nr:ATP-binding protein [Oceanibacterium hippocampi]SLN55243.1 Blue-light-activated protein [Oceanibacterium hippocampi]
MAYPTPENERARLEKLRSLDILDTPPEAAFDHVAQSVASALDVPIALVTLVDAERQWFKARYGIGDSEMPRDIAFCAHSIMGDEPLVIPDARSDSRFADNPLVVGPPNIRFYAGAPLRTANGINLGTVAGIDIRPRELDDRMRRMLVHSAALVVEILDFRHRAQQVLEAEQSGRLTAEAERQEREKRLNDSEEMLRQAAEIAGLGYYVWDAVADRCVFCSEAYARLHELSAEEFMARASTLSGDMGLTHPEDRERVRSAYRELRGGKPIDIRYRSLTSDGRDCHVREIARPVIDGTGRVVQEIGTGQDVTELVRTEESLRQTQKMEALGRLTGGVAHDFNNLLMVIQGNAEILQSLDNAAVDAYVGPLLRAAQRGTELTQRLLAFARRQTLKPQSLDLAELVDGMIALLERSLGEAIRIDVNVEAGLWNCRADPGQIENALLNLAINARDAMDGSGTVAIRLGNARLDENSPEREADTRPGDYVVLSVADSGVGMAPAVQARIFEPFYTTKPVRKGSGLGLPMVFGFVRQTGGQISVDSRPGAGTTVRLYLPRGSLPRNTVTRPVGTGAAPAGTGERVLVVEDDADIRALSVQMLRGLGYEPQSAADAAAAERLLEDQDETPPAAILCDVVLPGGISGPEFVVSVRRRHPDIAVIFMSGYSGGAIDGLTQGERRDPLLRKPFRRAELARLLREALGTE